MIAPFKDAMGEGSGMASGNGGEDARKIRLLMELRRGGIADTAVLAALERTPREIFVPEVFQDRAYENAGSSRSSRDRPSANRMSSPS